MALWLYAQADLLKGQTMSACRNINGYLIMTFSLQVENKIVFF